LICEAWKWRFVGIKKECSREPCERTRGRREEEDRGVETPVWGPVEVPYMMGGYLGGVASAVYCMFSRYSAKSRSASAEN
jgi:hypothetical protein